MYFALDFAINPIPLYASQVYYGSCLKEHINQRPENVLANTGLKREHLLPAEKQLSNLDETKVARN